MTWEEITKELFEEKTTKRFQIIHLGNPYDFVVKDHNTNKTYGTLQGDDKSLMELLNELHDKYIDEYTLRETLQLELQRVEEENKELKKQVNDLQLNKSIGQREYQRRLSE